MFNLFWRIPQISQPRPHGPQAMGICLFVFLNVLKQYLMFQTMCKFKEVHVVSKYVGSKPYVKNIKLDNISFLLQHHRASHCFKNT